MILSQINQGFRITRLPFVLERQIEGQHVEYDDPEGPNVRFGVVGLSQNHLWSPETIVSVVVLSKLLWTDAREMVHVCDLGPDRVGLRHYNILIIEVPNNDAKLVQVLECLSELLGDVDDKLFIVTHLGLALDDLRQFEPLVLLPHEVF